jgi:hypothetical protein
LNVSEASPLVNPAEFLDGLQELEQWACFLRPLRGKIRMTPIIFVACTERRRMSEQDQEREQVDEAQEDIELPEEQSEEVKGGAVIKVDPSAVNKG